MAEGVSGMMNIKLPHNFDSPYKAVSIEDFWRRWHMTLTGFLRKYIYFPLGGSRRGKIRTYINIMIIFLISGIWHGANYTFIIWGLIHGMLNCFDRLIKKLMPEKQNTLVKCIRVVLTFTAVNFLWLLFRCGSLSQAAMLFGRLFEGRTEGMTAVISSGFNIPEFRIVESFVPFAASMVTKMPALPAYIFLGAAAAVVFVCRNSHETEFKPDVKTALFTIAALFWSVMSFTGISSFIYAGF
jgi:D-alanyl-lipoteichoic acid acyltransferase DltB (MBOAT superfamily)